MIPDATLTPLKHRENLCKNFDFEKYEQIYLRHIRKHPARGRGVGMLQKPEYEDGIRQASDAASQTAWQSPKADAPNCAALKRAR